MQLNMYVSERDFRNEERFQRCLLFWKCMARSQNTLENCFLCVFRQICCKLKTTGWPTQTTKQTPLPTSVNMVLLVSHMLSFIYFCGYFQTTTELSHYCSYQGLIKLEEPGTLDLYRKNWGIGSSRKPAFPTPGQQGVFLPLWCLVLPLWWNYSFYDVDSNTIKTGVRLSFLTEFSKTNL